MPSSSFVFAAASPSIRITSSTPASYELTTDLLSVSSTDPPPFPLVSVDVAAAQVLSAHGCASPRPAAPFGSPRLPPCAPARVRAQPPV